MAGSFIANALGGTTTTTSFSITLPATQAGDILTLEFAHRGTGDGTIAGTSVTTGGLTWALKHSQLFGSSAFSGKTYWTRATGNHSGQTVTGSSLTNACAAILTQYRGMLSSGDPLADATIVGEQNASGNETQAQITTTTPNAWVVLVVANSPDLAVSSQACTSPGTLTERAERLSTGGTDASISHASAEKAAAGGTGSFTWAQTNAASGSWAYAITPEPPPAIGGDGALQASSASVVGAGTSGSRGDGSAQAGASSVTGTGTVTSPPSEVRGSGTITVGAATVAGTGKTGSRGSGILLSATSQVSGAGTSASRGSGSLQASDSQVSGEGAGTTPSQGGSGNTVRRGKIQRRPYTRGAGGLEP